MFLDADGNLLLFDAIVANMPFSKDKWACLLYTSALLDIVGRDQPDQELTLEFNRERCVWEFQGAETELWKLPPEDVYKRQ